MTLRYTKWCVYIPYRVCFGPDAGTTERVGLVVSALPLLLWLQAELTHRLVHSHVVGQQVISNVELQPVAHAARIQELSRLCKGQRSEVKDMGGGGPTAFLCTENDLESM